MNLSGLFFSMDFVVLFSDGGRMGNGPGNQTEMARNIVLSADGGTETEHDHDHE